MVLITLLLVALAFLLVSVILALSLIFLNKPKYSVQPAQLDVQVPPALPIFSHAFDLMPDNFLDSADKYYTKYGKFVTITAFLQKMIFIGDVATVKELLAKRPKVFRRPSTLDYSADVLGFNSGLFHTHGASWNRLRKLTSPTLAKHYIQSNVHDMCREAMNMVKHIEAQADGKSVVDVRHEMFLFTLHVIIHGAFGVEMKGEMAEYFFGTQSSTDIVSVFRFMMESALFPGPMWLWRTIPYFYNMELTAKIGNDRFTRLAQTIIDQKRKELAENPEGGNRYSVIDIMIKKETADLAGGAEVTDEEIMGNVKTFFVAGSETTSVALSWALYLLILHKDILQEAREEVAPFFAKSNSERSREELWHAFSAEKMPLTNAIIKETLRLYTPGSMVFGELEKEYKEYTLSNGLVLVPGEIHVCNFDAIHWDEENFPQGRSFVPKRWLTTDAALLSKMESCYFAFGGGTRACPGVNLALIEAVIGLSALIHHFDFELACPRSEIRRIMTFTAAPTKMPMTFTKRS